MNASDAPKAAKLGLGDRLLWLLCVVLLELELDLSLASMFKLYI